MRRRCRLKASTAISVVAALVLAAAASSAGIATQPSVSLIAGSVDGHVLLGKTVSGVTAALGKPTWRSGGATAYRVGYGDRANFNIMVLFRRRVGIFRAWSVAFEKPPVYELRLRMNVLVYPPRAFANAALNAYGAALKITRPPRCSATLCSVTLHVTGTSRNVTYGRTPRLGTFLTLSSG